MSTNRPPNLSPPPIPPPMELASSRVVGMPPLPPPVEMSSLVPSALSPEALPAEPVAEEPQEVKEYEVQPGFLNSVPCWLVSMVVHVGMMIAAGLIVSDDPPLIEPVVVISTPIESLIDVDDEQFDDEVHDELDLEIVETEIVIADEPDLEPEPSLSVDPTAAAKLFLDPDETAFFSQKVSDGIPDGVPSGDELAGRGEQSRGYLVRTGGGNDESERAVALALQWLAAHQHKDGGWSFDHVPGTKCRNRCTHSGRAIQARIGATAMALLPFLGAGHTHQQGKYRTVVYRGIHYLKRNQNEETGSMREPTGRMYSHGLAAIALCEAYTMTKDTTLRGPAQRALDYIVDAQDPKGGGWRYGYRQAGDTSVVGWQVMALKSGYLSYLRVPKKAIEKANSFLDSVQDGDYGSYYGYTGPGKRQATTSIGLLCRMYLGWKKDHIGLLGGIDYLSKTGPSRANMYYNYYATQVMHHFGGDEWKKWNSKMRDQLVRTQSTQGHAKGSWFMSDSHVHSGGRLYCTSMATMILEVYYRHLPIYRKRSTEDDFVID